MLYGMMSIDHSSLGAVHNDYSIRKVVFLAMKTTRITCIFFNHFLRLNIRVLL